MESRRIVSLDRVADRERKHSGEEASEIRGARAPGRRIDLAFLGQLAFEPSPIGASERRVPGQQVARAFLGRLAFGLGPIEALGLGWLARGTEPGLMVPTMPPFFLSGRTIVPGWKKGQA